MSCSNCHWWCRSDVVKRESNGYTKRCIASKKKVQADSKQCKYFNPTIFNCDNFGCRLNYNQCIARRRNEKNLLSWELCKNCRQFDKEIRPIIERYFLDLVPIVTPRRLLRKEEIADPGNQKRVLKRRDGKENKSPLTKAFDVLLPKTRTLKRRPTEKKRTLRRR